MSIPTAVFSWSGGKDSAYCLHKVLSQKSFETKYLLTTVNEDFKRISMHGVREELLDKQAEAINIPLLKIYVSEGTNQEYEQKMEEVLLKVRSEGIEYVIFGDIFLEDLRKYRENNVNKLGMKAVFPLWKMDTKNLLADFISQQFKSILCCTNHAYLGKEWVTREINESFAEELPAGVDACGENGEYHTFCFDGPLFHKKIEFSVGEKVYKPLDIKTTGDTKSQVTTNGFWFCDLLPSGIKMDKEITENTALT